MICEQLQLVLVRWYGIECKSTLLHLYVETERTASQWFDKVSFLKLVQHCTHFLHCTVYTVCTVHCTMCALFIVQCVHCTHPSLSSKLKHDTASGLIFNAVWAGAKIGWEIPSSEKQWDAHQWHHSQCQHLEVWHCHSMQCDKRIHFCSSTTLVWTLDSSIRWFRIKFMLAINHLQMVQTGCCRSEPHWKICNIWFSLVT